MLKFFEIPKKLSFEDAINHYLTAEEVETLIIDANISTQTLDRLNDTEFYELYAMEILHYAEKFCAVNFPSSTLDLILADTREPSTRSMGLIEFALIQYYEDNAPRVEMK